MTEVKTTNGSAVARRPEGAVAQWNPWSELTDLRQRIDDLFSRAFGYTPISAMIPADWQANEPTVDVHETEDQFQVLASLPGYKPDQIQINASDNSITMQGERPALLDNMKASPHRDNGVSGSSRFQFAYTLPAEIDANKIKATFENGVLRLELPKSENARSRTVRVPISAS